MRVRRARPADALAIQRVVARSTRAAYADILHDESLIEHAEREGYVAELRIDLRVSKAHGTVVWLVCTGTEGITGIAQVVWGQSSAASLSLGPHEALLRSLYVVPEHWGEGIGTRLLNRGRAALPAEISRLTVGVLPDNDIGYGFYRTHDFEKVGETQVTVNGTCYGIDLLACER